jgi:hypothetical protein
MDAHEILRLKFLLLIADGPLKAGMPRGQRRGRRKSLQKGPPKTPPVDIGLKVFSFVAERSFRQLIRPGGEGV